MKFISPLPSGYILTMRTTVYGPKSGSDKLYKQLIDAVTHYKVSAYLTAMVEGTELIINRFLAECASRLEHVWWGNCIPTQYNRHGYFYGSLMDGMTGKRMLDEIQSILDSNFDRNSPFTGLLVDVVSHHLGMMEVEHLLTRTTSTSNYQKVRLDPIEVSAEILRRHIDRVQPLSLKRRLSQQSLVTICEDKSADDLWNYAMSMIVKHMDEECGWDRNRYTRPIRIPIGEANVEYLTPIYGRFSRLSGGY